MNSTETLMRQLIARGANRDIENFGFTEISIDPKFLAPRLEDITTGMKVITDTPSLRELLDGRKCKLDAYGENYRQEVGLYLRKDAEHKYFFHYTPEAFEDEPLASGALSYFFAALKDLDAEARKMALAISECLDRTFEHAKDKPYRGSLRERFEGGNCVTRVLRYLPLGTSAADAFPHGDRGGWTPHWGASHEGLVVIGPDGKQFRVSELDPSRVALFPGRKYAAITRGKRQGTLHGVRYERKVQEDRYCVVSFVHPKPTKRDGAWLQARDAEMKAYERQFTL